MGSILIKILFRDICLELTNSKINEFKLNFVQIGKPIINEK